MNTNKKFFPIFLLIFILCILYIVFAARPLGTEYQLEPVWKIDVSNPTVSPSPNGVESHCFKLGQSMGYFTEDGLVTNFKAFPYKASISKNYYTYYNANNTSADFFTPDGKKVGAIQVPGFPMICDDRIYVFLPGGAAFIQCGKNGEKLWEFSGTIPITAFDSSEGGCVAGFADGTVCEFSPSGEVIQKFSPGGSNYPVILGAALSKDSSYVAVICGQQRQRFVLAKNEGTNSRIIFHEFLEDSDSLQKMVRFYNNDKTVIYNSGNTLGIVSTNGGKSSHIKIKGQALNVQEAGNLIFVLTKDTKNYNVYIIEHFATLVGTFSFKADTAFIRTAGDSLYIGKDNSISKMNVTKK